MSETKNAVCTKDYFDIKNTHLFTKGKVYEFDKKSITTNIESRLFLISEGIRSEFFNEYFRELKEDDPIDALMQQSEKYWCNAGKEPQQQSEHYQKDNKEDLETIEKMQIISDIFEEQGRTFTAMEGYTLLNQYKYLDRMGKKDDPKKEGYKICDYYERNKSEKWLHEVDK